MALVGSESAGMYQYLYYSVSTSAMLPVKFLCASLLQDWSWLSDWTAGLFWCAYCVLTGQKSCKKLNFILKDSEALLSKLCYLCYNYKLRLGPLEKKYFSVT